MNDTPEENKAAQHIEEMHEFIAENQRLIESCEAQCPYCIDALPPVEDMMTSELKEARRDLLIAETASDYAEWVVIYNRQRVERLTASLKES